MPIGPKLSVAAVLAALALGGCEQVDGVPTLSLEEAKEATAALRGLDYVPPPRSVADITELLKSQALADADKVARLQAKAEQPPPDPAPRELWKFLYGRGMAAYNVGRVGQSMADLEQALQIARSLPGEDYSGLLIDLSIFELQLGNYSNGIELRLEGLKHLSATRMVKRLSCTRLLSGAYAAAGDLDRSQAVFRDADRLLSELEGERWFVEKWRGWGIAQRERVQSMILLASGKYRESEMAARSALRQAANVPGTSRRRWYELAVDLMRWGLSRALLAQGRLAEAEIEARAAIVRALQRTGAASGQTGFLLTHGLIPVLLEQERYEDARVLAEAVLDIYQQAGAARDARILITTRAEIAEALAYQGRWSEALEQYERIHAAVPQDNYTFRRFIANKPIYNIVLAKDGMDQPALEALEEAVARKRKNLGEDHYETAELQSVFAMALARQGDWQQALEAFQRAIPTLVTDLGLGESGGTARQRRLRLILESYMALLGELERKGVETSPGAVPESFRLANVARANSVQRAVLATSARAAAGDPALADLARREQDARRRVSALHGLLSRAVSQGTPDESVVGDLLAQIDRLRGARAVLLSEIEQRFPAYAQLVDPKPTTLARAHASLRPGEVLISTYVAEKRTFVWAVPETGDVAFAVVPLGQSEASATVARLRWALEPKARTLGEIPEFDVTLAHELYAQFLAPVADSWRGAERLLVVAHGPLGQLPFGLLVEEPFELGPQQAPLFARYATVPWLARSHAVTVLPSVASLVTLRGLPAGEATRQTFAGFADPVFNAAQAASAKLETTAQLAATSRDVVATRGLPIRLRSLTDTAGLDSADLANLPRLPDTAAEVRAIAAVIGADAEADVFLGARASETMVKAMDLSDRKVIVFATHGLVPGDLDGLTQPALALTPGPIAEGADDGILTMGEILGLRLDADWVVLSACNTAAAEGKGAEAVSGLGRAFFYAGTRALLVSNWPVETTSAKAITTDLFRRQAADPSLGRAEALQQAMLGLIDGPGYLDGEGRQVFSYAHPIFWAPFSLVGDGGSTALQTSRR